jgi:hypothetical protein
MKEHKCELCNVIFYRKEHLTRHLNKLRKCNVVTDFSCEWCNKSFTSNFSLSRHITTCKIKESHELLEMQMQEKADDIEELKAKYELLEQKLNSLPLSSGTVTSSTNPTINGNSNTNSSTTNNNSHNINHITINNYGSEDLSHINLKQITFVFSKRFKSVIECVKLKHFSPLAPQNRNVCIKDIKSKYAYVFCDGNWDIVGRIRLIDDMYSNICDYIEEKLDELIDELDERDIIYIKRFLSEKDDDKIANDIKCDLAMLLFNKRYTCL